MIAKLRNIVIKNNHVQIKNNQGNKKIKEIDINPVIVKRFKNIAK